MTSYQPLVVLALLVFGLVQVFFGYRLFRILVGVIGALFGFFYAPEMIALATGEVPSTAVAVAVGVGLAIAFALVAWYVFWLAVFAWGASLGYVVGVSAFGDLPWLALVTGLVVGGLAMLFQRVLIVLLSALNGAWLLVSGSAFLLGQIATPPRGLPFDPLLDINEPVSLVLFAVTLVIAVVGAVYQFRDTTPMLGHKD
ncbi:MAG: TMEM198/TM7SF3 family protein [Gammaproteobacteria bacterium]|nr:TMEM198/TM7SF3 family protein [Gammaproteobacteria bacterium]